VQDAFLAAWRTAAAFDARRGSAQTWLLTLVHRRAVDVVRREERRRTDPLDDAPIAAGESTEEVASVREQRRDVQAALAQLPDEQREALELSYYGGLTQSELAERLGIPLGTVKSRVFAGLTKLRELLETS
jgi:RNA polymerase sigma-70 factor, ECF subfamily